MEIYPVQDEKNEQSELSSIAHFFGGALYKAIGLPGIMICDQRFNFGYDYQNLLVALEACSSFRAQPEVGGCYGGVFMEYNLQTVLGDEGLYRPMNRKLGEHYPCSVLNKQYKSACYYEQPQWWQATLYDQWEDKGKRYLMFEQTFVILFCK